MQSLKEGCSFVFKTKGYSWSIDFRYDCCTYLVELSLLLTCFCSRYFKGRLVKVLGFYEPHQLGAFLTMLGYHTIFQLVKAGMKLICCYFWFWYYVLLYFGLYLLFSGLSVVALFISGAYRWCFNGYSSNHIAVKNS